jgi:hypothetical protein
VTISQPMALEKLNRYSRAPTKISLRASQAHCIW